MAIRLREYHRPATLGDALGLLGRGDIRTSLMTHGARIPVTPFAGYEAVVDLSRLQLEGLMEDGGLIQIGSQVTLEKLVDDPTLNGLVNGILPQAARLAAASGLRRLATLGGLLAAPDDAPEIELVLLALEATVVTQDAERREVALADYRPGAGEVIIGVRIPRPPARCGGALARVARSPLDRAVVSVAATVTDTVARVAVAGASRRPLLKVAAGGLLTSDGLGRLAESIAAEAELVGDYLGSAEYRKAMAGVLARRALNEATQQVKEQYGY